jgi:hypothetical protein
MCQQRPVTLLSAVFALLWLFCGAAAFADVAAVTLEEEVAFSSAIGVAKVERVVSVGGVKVALATVRQSLKGLRVGQRLAVIAQPTWTCDTSTARQGETALLFLERFRVEDFAANFPDAAARFTANRKSQLAGLEIFNIAHAGNGRLPVLMSGNRETLWATPNYPQTEPQIVSIGNSMIALPVGFSYHPSADRPGVMPSGRVLLRDVTERVRRLIHTPRALGR